MLRIICKVENRAWRRGAPTPSLAIHLVATYVIKYDQNAIPNPQRRGRKQILNWKALATMNSQCRNIQVDRLFLKCCQVGLQVSSLWLIATNLNPFLVLELLFKCNRNFKQFLMRIRLGGGQDGLLRWFQSYDGNQRK